MLQTRNNGGKYSYYVVYKLLALLLCLSLNRERGKKILNKLLVLEIRVMDQRPTTSESPGVAFDVVVSVVSIVSAEMSGEVSVVVARSKSG